MSKNKLWIFGDNYAEENPELNRISSLAGL